MSSSSKPKSGRALINRHYTDEERHTLIQLVLDRIDVIEKRQSDTLTLTLKQQVWQDIVARFNADPCCVQPRDLRQIKKLWDNVKTRSKRMVADRRLQKAMQATDEQVGQEGSEVDESARVDDFADLDMIADDSLAEKVIYFMSRTSLQRKNRHMAFDDDDDSCDIDMDDDQQRSISYIDEDGEVVHYILPKGEDLLPNENPSSLSSSKRALIADSLYHPPKRRVRISPDETSQETYNPASTSRPSMSSPEMPRIHGETANGRNNVFLCEAEGNHSPSQLAIDGEPVHQTDVGKGQSAFKASRLSTAFTRPPINNGDDWIPSSPQMSDKDGGGAGFRAGTATAPPKQQQRSLKKMQKLECALKIKKLRLEMKYARMEHEEKMKVLCAQKDVLSSLRPNPSSIIGALFK